MRDTFMCPEGKDLRRWVEQRRDGKPPVLLYRRESCRECAVKGALPTAGRVEPVFGQLKWDSRKPSMNLPACSR
jgi:hypothetical protein